MKLCDDGVYNLAAAVLAQARRDYICGINHRTKGGGEPLQVTRMKIRKWIFSDNVYIALAGVDPDSVFREFEKAAGR